MNGRQESRGPEEGEESGREPVAGDVAGSGGARDGEGAREGSSGEGVSFGAFLRERRERLKESDPRYSLRQVAGRVGIQPSYLSQVERDLVPPPGEETMVRLAEELDLDPDVVLALGGKVSTDLKEAIQARPKLFAELIRRVRELPDDAVLRVVREVRDGEW